MSLMMMTQIGLEMCANGRIGHSRTLPNDQWMAHVLWPSGTWFITNI